MENTLTGVLLKADTKRALNGPSGNCRAQRKRNGVRKPGGSLYPNPSLTSREVEEQKAGRVHGALWYSLDLQQSRQNSRSQVSEKGVPHFLITDLP